MFERVGLPEGLADTAPGPELARMLAAVDRSRPNGYDVVTLTQARADLFLDLLTGSSKAHAGRAVVDLEGEFQTVTGMAESPGEIPRWGPVVADIARQVAADQQRGEWRVTVTDPKTDHLERNDPAPAHAVSAALCGGPASHLCLPWMPYARPEL